MRIYHRIAAKAVTVFLFSAMVTACGKKTKPDAYGDFEANEVIVSSEAAGRLTSFTATEGATIASGAVVGTVDTIQLGLEKDQTIAQRAATIARVNAAGSQAGVYEAQLGIARRNYDRTRRLFDQHAATAQQLDQAERDVRTLLAQIAAAHSQKESVAREVTSTDARVAQIRDRISRSTVTNPADGTVLATYTRAGEVVQPGQPLYRIANLDTLTLRAYVDETQLTSLVIGQRVQVHVDDGDGRILTLPGVVSWVAAKAEFTPTPVQTRDERADLVYGVKILVANPRGRLKIGMPADVSLGASPKGT